MIKLVEKAKNNSFIDLGDQIFNWYKEKSVIECLIKKYYRLVN